MNVCTILRLDPARKRKAAPEELPAHSAMIGDGVMHIPVERRQAEVHGCDEMHERRRQRQSARA